ncbi:hypothetical protein [Mameliella sp. AT18]|uniref:hypothetical protein n=1 Tax=Mameliella sp. AT18 TaxID=3028385 RepID=UPI00237B5568|nr:hypothetical protein [Mameliella sp. AT18]
MDDAESRDDALHVAPKQSAWSRCTETSQPVLPWHAASPLAQRLTDTIKNHAEILIVLNKFKDVDDYISRSGVGHHALNLARLMQPELAQIVIDGFAGLFPELQCARRARRTILDLEEGRNKCVPVARSNAVADKVEPVIQGYFFLSRFPYAHRPAAPLFGFFSFGRDECTAAQNRTKNEWDAKRCLKFSKSNSQFPTT